MGLVVLRELRVLCDWAHDLPNEMMSTHGIGPRLIPQLSDGRCFGDLRRHGASSDQRQGWPSGGLLAQSASGVAPLTFEFLSKTGMARLRLQNRGLAAGGRCKKGDPGYADIPQKTDYCFSLYVR